MKRILLSLVVLSAFGASIYPQPIIEERAAIGVPAVTEGMKKYCPTTMKWYPTASICQKECGGKCMSEFEIQQTIN